MQRCDRPACAARAFTLDLRSLALFRIGLGCLLVADCLLRSRDFSPMLSPDGILPPDLVRGYLADPAAWSLAFLSDTAWWNGIVLALEGLAGLLLILGLHTRLATVTAWVMVVSLIRRTATANNSGDLWLAGQLLWASFLPLGTRWSLDCRRQPAQDPRPTTVCSVATAALVLQLAAVYLGAGIAKCNASWLSGDALRHALSVHDHGTPLGMAVGSARGTSSLQGLVLAAELALPFVLVAVPRPGVRLGLVLLAILFHAAIGCLMNVGLFAAVGIVAWLPLVPATAWPATTGPRMTHTIGLTRWPSLACGLLLALAAAAFTAGQIGGPDRPLPRPLAAFVDLAFLRQEWRMFGTVRNQEQWVACRATLANGQTIDPLRRGQPADPGPPEGGFWSLPSHRWHRFLWRLPEPTARPFAPPAAAAIARAWNSAHPADEQILKLEIWCGSFDREADEGTFREALLASWPPRSAAGSGSLDRFLEEQESSRHADSPASSTTLPERAPAE